MNEEERKRIHEANSPKAYERRELVQFLIECIYPHDVKHATIEQFADLLEGITEETGYHYDISKTPLTIAFHLYRFGVVEQLALTLSQDFVSQTLTNESFEYFRRYVVDHINEMKKR
jgi:hypothetical protein